MVVWNYEETPRNGKKEFLLITINQEECTIYCQLPFLIGCFSRKLILLLFQKKSCLFQPHPTPKK
jgi:hypothetical protein